MDTNKQRARLTGMTIDEFLGSNGVEDTASLLRDSIGIPPDVKIGRYIMDPSLDSKTFAIVCAIYLLEDGLLVRE